MSRKRFKFDDETNDLEEDLQPFETGEKSINNINESLDESTNRDSGDESMGKV